MDYLFDRNKVLNECTQNLIEFFFKVFKNVNCKNTNCER